MNAGASMNTIPAHPTLLAYNKILYAIGVYKSKTGFGGGILNAGAATLGIWIFKGAGFLLGG